MAYGYKSRSTPRPACAHWSLQFVFDGEVRDPTVHGLKKNDDLQSERLASALEAAVAKCIAVEMNEINGPMAVVDRVT